MNDAALALCPTSVVKARHRAVLDRVERGIREATSGLDAF